MKRRFPIIFKVISLGIAVSILTSGTAIVISHLNQKRTAEQNYVENIDNTLDAVDELFTNVDSQYTDAYVDYLKTVRKYVQDIYDADPEKRERREDESFEEYAAYYKSMYPYLYPKDDKTGFISQYEAEVKAAFYTVSSLLNNYLRSSDSISVFVYYTDEANRMVFLDDTRMHDPERKPSEYFHIPGTYHQIGEDDQVGEKDSKNHQGFVLDGYTARSTSVFTIAKIDEPSEYLVNVSIQYSLDKVHQSVHEVLNTELLIMGLTSVALIVIYTLFSYLLFVRNINKLSKASSDIKERLANKKMNQVTNIEVKSNDEMRVLADSFNEMEHAIINYVDIIHKEAKEKERTNAELAVASKIQLDSLPNSKFDDSLSSIRAYIKPAKEVSGDFYDYFYLDDHRLALIISDVSGKGIPASLFMMKGKELIKSTVASYKNLVDAINVVNKRLAQNNNELLFITSFIGIIDFNKNKINFVNAGHEKPYLVSNNKVIKLDGASNVVLGVDEDYTFKEESHEFKQGDYLLMFTDGLNEAINKENEEFGYKRIEKALENTSSLPLNEVIERINKSFESFTDSKEQFDDVTMLLVKTQSGELNLDYDKKDFNIITDAIDQFNSHFDFLNKTTRASVGIILDEILNNFISYEEKKDLQINIKFSLTKEGIQVSLSHNGSDFNPFKNHKQKVLQEFNHDIEPGGFGLTIVKSLSKSYEYKLIDGHPTIKVVVE